MNRNHSSNSTSGIHWERDWRGLILLLHPGDNSMEPVSIIYDMEILLINASAREKYLQDLEDGKGEEPWDLS